MPKCILLFSIFIFGMQISFAQCESFTLTISANNPTCYNFNDGDIDLTISGGTNPYTIAITDENGTLWNGGKKSNNLGPGWYFIFIIDANGCEIYDSIQLINPPQMIAEISTTDPSFVGACDGTALVDTVLNYQGDYALISYFWSPGGPSGLGQTNKTDLCDAYYSLTINDALGCSITTSLSIGSVSISESKPIVPITLFPNPFSESTTLHVDPIYFGETFYISNQLGEIVKVIQINSETILLDRENLPNGIYFFSLGNQQGKFVVQ